MRVKNRIVLETLRALSTLDGGEKERFKFSPLTLLSLARNVRRLKDTAEDIERTRQQLVRDYGVGKWDEKGNRIPDSSEKLRAFNDAFQQVLDVEADVDLFRIKIKELRLEQNNIPVTALAALDWLLDEDQLSGSHAG